MITRRRLTAALCLALLGIAGATPAPASIGALVAAELPEQAWVEVDGDWFRVDFSELLAGRSGVAAGAGSFTVSVRKAGPGRPEAGGEAMFWTLTRTPGRVTSSFEAGPDRLTLGIPRSVLEGDPLPGDRVDVEVNGTFTSIPPERYYRAVNDLLRGRPPLEDWEELAPLAGRFVDGRGFLDSYTDFAALADKVVKAALVESGCLAPCTTCVGSAIGSVASFLVISGACSLASAATAGVLSPVCVGALLAHAGSNLSTLMFCGFCIECLTGPPGSGPGDGDGGDDPSGECPPGYHECCENQCCSDEDPPSSCEEP